MTVLTAVWLNLVTDSMSRKPFDEHVLGALEELLRWPAAMPHGHIA